MLNDTGFYENHSTKMNPETCLSQHPTEASKNERRVYN